MFHRRMCEGEPHSRDRATLIEAHPEVMHLMGPEPLTKYIVLLTVLAQVGAAAAACKLDASKYMVLAYAVGATLNHTLFLAIHELSHNLAAKKPWQNKALAIVANLPVGFPYAIVFRTYHMAHHKWMGDAGQDTDIPSRLEAYLVTGSATCYVDHCARKLLFMLFHVFAYALRPVLMKPSMMQWDRWVALNWAAQILFNVAVCRFLGLKAMLYLLWSTFWAGSLLHPLSAHFIAEHYTQDGKHETASYYGKLNKIAYNVGYHREHHTLVNVPWSRIEGVRIAMADMVCPDQKDANWKYALLDFAFNQRIGLYSRVVGVGAEQSIKSD